MSEADEQFVNCLWTQIEELLSLPPEEREAVDIEDVSTWFRNRSSLFQSIDKRKGIFLIFFFLTNNIFILCLLYTSPSPRDATLSRMPSSA